MRSAAWIAVEVMQFLSYSTMNGAEHSGGEDNLPYAALLPFGMGDCGFLER